MQPLLWWVGQRRLLVDSVVSSVLCLWCGRVVCFAPLRVLVAVQQVQTGMSAGLRTLLLLLLLLPLLLLLLLLLQRCCCYVVKRAKHGCEGHMLEERRGSSGTLGASSAGTNGHSRLSSNQEKEATNRGGGWGGWIKLFLYIFCIYKYCWFVP